MSASDFSFNRPGGRCEKCAGLGYQAIEMQFLPTVRMTCPDCGGARFEKRILDVKYRGRNIDQVLELTASQAFGFFRNQPRLQARLQLLRDVGLGYLCLGQPLVTLSGGEAQRLKLASYLGARQGRRCLLVFEEPTSGLHPADIETLLRCLAALLDVGHSLVVVEHNPQVLAAADHVIELGPGAGADGGQVIAQGTPVELTRAQTPTAQTLRRWLRTRAETS